MKRAKFVVNFIINDLRGLMNKRKIKYYPIHPDVLGMYGSRVEDGSLDKNVARKSLLAMAAENADKGILWNGRGESVGKTWKDYETEEERTVEKERIITVFYAANNLPNPEQEAKATLQRWKEKTFTESY